MHKDNLLIFLIGVLFFFSSSVLSQELIEPNITFKKPQKEFERIMGSGWRIYIDGDITSNTPQILDKFLTTNKTPELSTIIFNSPGGSLYGGMELGRIIRKHRLMTSLGSRPEDYNATLDKIGICYSACAYAYLGGVFRWFPKGSRYGVHRFYASNGSKGNMDNAQITSAQLVSYIREMGADPDVFSLSTLVGADDIYEPPIDLLQKLNVVTYGFGPTSWSLESKEGSIYLKGERDTEYGLNKLILTCNGKNGVLLYALWDAQGHDDELQSMSAISLVTDMQDEPMENVMKLPTKGLFQLMHVLTQKEIQRIIHAETVGVIIRNTYDSPIFLGFNAMPFSEAKEKLSGLVNTCHL